MMHNPAHRMVMSLHFCNFMNGILQMPMIFFLWLLRRDDPHLSTIVESLLLSCCSSSGYFSLTLRCHRSTRFCVDHTHVQRKTPRATGTIPSRAQSSPSWKKACHWWPNHENLEEANSLDRPFESMEIKTDGCPTWTAAVAVWWWLILWIFCLLSDPCACEERCAGVDWVFGWWSVLAEDRAMRSIWCFVAAPTCCAKHIVRSK